MVWGLERFIFHLNGKQVQLFSDHQALKPLLKKNKSNKQYSARLTLVAGQTKPLRHYSEIHSRKRNQIYGFYQQKTHRKRGTGRKLRRGIRNKRHRATSDGKLPHRTDFQPIRIHQRGNHA